MWNQRYFFFLPPFFFLPFFFAAIPPHPHSAPEELMHATMNLCAQLHQHKETKSRNFFDGVFRGSRK
jgi:hypothetical protein